MDNLDLAALQYAFLTVAVETKAGKPKTAAIGKMNKLLGLFSKQGLFKGSEIFEKLPMRSFKFSATQQPSLQDLFFTAAIAFLDKPLKDQIKTTSLFSEEQLSKISSFVRARLLEDANAN